MWALNYRPLTSENRRPSRTLYIDCSKKELKKEKIKKIKQINEKRNQLKIKQIEDRKLLILNSGINFTKLGWVEQVANLLNISHKNTVSWIKKHMPEFYSNCFVRKSPNN